MRHMPAKSQQEDDKTPIDRSNGNDMQNNRNRKLQPPHESEMG